MDLSGLNTQGIANKVMQPVYDYRYNDSGFASGLPYSSGVTEDGYRAVAGGGTVLGDSTYKTQAQKDAENKAANDAKLRNEATIGKDNSLAGAQTGYNQWYDAKNQNILDWISKYTTSMDALNKGYTDAEMGKANAYSGIMGMLDRGIRSAGSMLASKNASNSSAAG